MKRTRSFRAKAESTPILHYAVRLLSARPYSEKRLFEKLRERGYASNEIDGAIVRLKEKRLLNDQSFTEDFIHARCRSHPRGRTSLIQDLIGRGIPVALAQETANELVSDKDEAEMALRLIQGKLHQYSSLDEDVRKRRVAGLLGRRGFRPQTIFSLLEKLDTMISTQNGDSNSNL